MKEGNTIQMTAANSLPRPVTPLLPAPFSPPPPLFLAQRNAVELVAFMVFSHSESTEDKRPLC